VHLLFMFSDLSLLSFDCIVFNQTRSLVVELDSSLALRGHLHILLLVFITSGLRQKIIRSKIY
jgi:hypothetical protein